MFDTSFLIIVFLSLLGVAVAYVAHKVRRVHLSVYRLEAAILEAVRHDSRETFRQLEALGGLQRELAFARSLPPTRGWAGSPDFLLLIASHCLAERPDVVLECSSGVSTLVLGRAVQRNGSGHVYSLEHDPAYAARTRSELARHGLSDWVSVLDAPIVVHDLEGERWSWYDTAGLPADSIDMLVVDGPPEATGPQARYPAAPLMFARLSPAASVFLDDAARPDEQLILRRWVQEFPDWQVLSFDLEKGAAQLRKVLP